MPLSKNAINYCPIKYHCVLSRKFAKILNKNNNNVKIVIRTYNNSIITINYKVEQIINNLSVNINSYSCILLFICSCNKMY